LTADVRHGIVGLSLFFAPDSSHKRRGFFYS
jgi:hypothetical protein